MVHSFLLLLAGDDVADFPESLNLVAVAGFALAVTVAVTGLFVLPALRDLGLAFRAAFAVVAVAELSAAVVAALSVYHLYD